MIARSARRGRREGGGKWLGGGEAATKVRGKVEEVVMVMNMSALAAAVVVVGGMGVGKEGDVVLWKLTGVFGFVQ